MVLKVNGAESQWCRKSMVLKVNGEDETIDAASASPSAF
jgi:hypothetical protein